MGCTTPRAQTAYEEVFLAEEQRKLGLDDLDSVTVDLTVRKYCFHAFVNTLQLRRIESDLHVTLHDEGSWAEVGKMMSCLETGAGWDSKKLLILCILCSRASPFIKAKLLFESADDCFAGYLSEAEMQKLFKEMCYISTTVLGSLVPPTHRTAPVIERYLRKCSASTDRSVSILMKHFKPRCNDSDFVQVLASLHEGLFLTPSGIRSYLHVEYTRNGPGKDFSNMSSSKRTGRLSSIGDISSNERRTTGSVDFLGPSRYQSSGDFTQLSEGGLASSETSTNEEQEKGTMGRLSSLNLR